MMDLPLEEDGVEEQPVRISLHGRRQLDFQQIERALLDAHGITSVAAAALGIGRATLDGRIRQSPRLREVVRHARAEILDDAEWNVFRRVEKGDLKLSLWVLSRLGRERGYGKIEEVRHAGPDGETLKVETTLRRELDVGGLSDVLGILADAGVIPAGVVPTPEEGVDSSDDGVHSAHPDA
jgi:hypothetical protein